MPSSSSSLSSSSSFTLPLATSHHIRRNKRLREKARIIPWRDFWEFQWVGQVLCQEATTTTADHDLLLLLDNTMDNANNNNNNKNGVGVSCRCGDGDNGPPSTLSALTTSTTIIEEALERVAVWKARSQRIPHAVESTAALAQIILRDHHTTVMMKRQQQKQLSAAAVAAAPFRSSRTSAVTTTTTTTTTELRLAYASAILRSVNGLADVLQQQRATASSVAYLCRQLGIPDWLVDIRHESTHNQLPTLPVLRKAASSLLQFFQNVYWQPLLQDERPEQIHRAMSLLRVYYNVAQEQQKTKDAAKQQAQSTTSILQHNSNNTTTNGESASESENDNDDDDDSNDDDDNDDDLIDELWGISNNNKLGTSTNSFAALQAPSKRKKRSPKTETGVVEAVVVVDYEEPPKKKKKAINPSSNINNNTKKNPTPTMCAKAFVKAHIPFDVARYCLLSFLVWKGIDNDESNSTDSTCGGVLLPSSEPSHSFGQNNNDVDKDFRQFSNIYAPLLITICREWPGLFHSILIHMVDAILSIEDYQEQQNATTNNDDDDDDIAIQQKLFYLESWVRFLLSRQFLLSTFQGAMSKLPSALSQDDDNNDNNNSNNKSVLLRKDDAVKEILQRLQPPLTSLYHRCNNNNKSGRHHHHRCRRRDDRTIDDNIRMMTGPQPLDTSSRLAMLFSNLLELEAPSGDVYGLVQPLEQQDHTETGYETQEVCMENKADEKLKNKRSQRSNTVVLSLDEMEKLLEESNNNDDDNNNGDDVVGDDVVVAVTENEPTNGDTLLPMSFDKEIAAAAAPAVKKQRGIVLSRQSWVRCDFWDPCAIGTLPGFPM